MQVRKIKMKVDRLFKGGLERILLEEDAHDWSDRELPERLNPT